MRLPSPFHLVFVVIAASLPATSKAQEPKPSWRWTLDERLAQRHDPVAAAARLRAEAGRVSSLATTATAKVTLQGNSDYISGRDHPELFLPWELFDHMMTMAYADDTEVRSIFREAKSSSLSGCGLPVDFWDRMEAISVAYLSDGSQLRDLHKQPVSDADVKSRMAIESHALENLKCRDRADAIAAARHVFGEKFDRLLYEAIAPSMSIGIGRLGPISEARQREIEAGCR
jgi:hypothetical protein